MVRLLNDRLKTVLISRIIQILYGILLVIAISPVSTGYCDDSVKQDRLLLLQQAQTWMYQLQELDTGQALQALAKSDYPLLVVEPGHNHKDDPANGRNLMQILGIKPDGSKRIVLAYINIGQAEDWRTYWQPDWTAPTLQQPGKPDFLLTIDPDGWQGCYPVAYWDQRWKDIWIGPDGIVTTLARMGFDGVYLDWVTAYADRHIQRYAQKEKINPAQEMLRLIEEIGQAGKKITPDFLVAVQNAPFLIDHDPARYLQAVDALFVEDTWFYGSANASWHDAQAGDLPNRENDRWSTKGLLLQYGKYLQGGVPVFSVDYCHKQENAEKVYKKARKAGLRPLVTRVSLSRITGTPPGQKAPDNGNRF